jgi:cytosine/adenosine deaminase-related metal-dependent hydrolase
LPHLNRLRSSVGDDVVTIVQRQLLGNTAEKKAPVPSGRFLRGRPWSLAGALDRLTADDEPLYARTWTALELQVRTGIKAPVPLLPGASIDHHAKAAAALRAALAPAMRLRDGDWYYFGRPSPRSPK